MADKTFTDFAGQIVSNGISERQPVITFEQKSDADTYRSLQSVHGLVQKIGKTYFHNTTVYDSPLKRLFKESSMPFGVGVEQVQIKEGAINKKTDGACMPRGAFDFASQIDLLDFAFNHTVSIPEHAFDTAVLNEAEKESAVSNIVQSLYKGYATNKHLAYTQLISDVVDGVRDIDSTTNSYGTGTAVQYEPDIEGYAGRVEETNIVLPELELGIKPEFAAGSDAIDFIENLRNAAAEMKQESTVYNKLGINTFINGKPELVIEEKVINALDKAVTTDGASKRYPSMTTRQILNEFADVIEIPNFASLPTNAEYDDSRLAQVLIEKEAGHEFVQYGDLRTFDCVAEREIGYSLRGASTISIWKGAPSYALLTLKQ